MIAFDASLNDVAAMGDCPTEAEIDRPMNQLLDLIQLPEVCGRYASQLSGGQRQRVALARVIAIESRMLMLEQPCRGLDAFMAGSARNAHGLWCIKQLVDSSCETSVIAEVHEQTHSPELQDYKLTRI